MERLTVQTKPTRATDVWDIDERTFRFAVRVVKLVNTLPRTIAGSVIGKQVVRSGTSVNSNVVQARGGVSRADFLNHMRIALKEAKETERWLRMTVEAGLLQEMRVRALLAENKEIIAILTAIVRSTKS